MRAIQFHPGSATTRGGGILSVKLPEHVVQWEIASNSQWVVCFEGGSQRHLVMAQPFAAGGWCALQATIPARKNPEVVKIRVFKKDLDSDAVTELEVPGDGFAYEPDPVIRILGDIILRNLDRMDDLEILTSPSSTQRDEKDPRSDSDLDSRIHSALDEVFQSPCEDPPIPTEEGGWSPVAALVRWATHRKLWRSRHNIRSRLPNGPRLESRLLAGQKDQWQEEVIQNPKKETESSDAGGEQRDIQNPCALLQRQVNIEEVEEEEVGGHSECFGGSVAAGNERWDLHLVDDDIGNTTATCEESVRKLLQLVMDSNLTSQRVSAVNCSETSWTGSEVDSDEDVITCYVNEDTLADNGQEELKVTNTNRIPIISVTEHSPQPAMKVLDENLEHLNSIWETIQQLRKLDSHYSNNASSWDERRTNLARFSSSCPSLDECAGAEDPNLGKALLHSNNGDEDDDDDDDGESVNVGEMKAQMTIRESQSTVDLSCSPTGSSRVQICVNDVRVAGFASQERLDLLSTMNVEPLGSGSSSVHLKVLLNRDAPRRRRSWSALEQGDQDEEARKNLARTQRSMSLSSLDSDSEDAFYDAPDTPTLSQDSPPSQTSALDLADVTSCRSRRDKPRSLSGGCTPSCVLCLGNGCAAKFAASACHLQNASEASGTAVDGGEVRFKSGDDHKLLPPRTPLQKSISTPSILLAKDTAAATVSRDGAAGIITSHNVQECDDDPGLSKRKKRGSLFFRKKRGNKEKEKEVKKTSVGHQFVSVCYSNSTLCHVCGKPMANKPALRCENCMVNIHENACRNQVGDCVRFRDLSKMNVRPMSLQPPTQWAIPRDRPPVHSGGNLKPPSPASAGALGSSSSQSTSPTNKESRKQNGQSYFVPGISSPSKIINEEKEADAVDDAISNIFDSNSASMESLDEGAAEVNHIEDDPELRLADEEPEGWSSTIDKKLLKKMKDRDIKRQENIYEFIITEKHHCLTLKVMQKVFVHGMLRELHMTPDMVERIFPRLEDLLEVHVSFLKRLRERQKSESVVAGIGDILLQQFDGDSARQLKAAYGEFCSRHKEAVSLYKDIYKSDRKFQNFIKKCSVRPWCKARGIPECILLVTQRITKYPLLIEALLKSSKDYRSEVEDLGNANALVKDILNNVDAQVAEKEREQRLLEIYNRIDAKSATAYGGKKFKKSDLLSSNRKLRHESQVFLKQARGKPIEVIMVILSDVIFFLQDNTQKYTFVTQDNKAGVVSLQKLLVREKAGQDNRGIYLISSNPLDPEMYELVCHSNKEKKCCVDAIRLAVEMCPDEDEGIPSESEEERKLQEAKSAKLRELTGALHNKDRELAVICGEKMKILGDMMELVAKEEVLEPVNYLHLVDDLQEGPLTREMLLAAVHEASRLTSTLYVSGTNLSRSVSSAGEHQSEAYVSPILPKRAETFGGFDNPNKDLLPKPVVIKKKNAKEHEGWASNLVGLLVRSDHHGSTASDLDQKESESLLSVKAKEIRRASGPLPSRDPQSPGSPDKPCLRRSTLSTGFIPLLKGDQDGEQDAPKEADKDSLGELMALPTAPSLVALGREQWMAAIQLSHYLNTLMCIFSQHFTSVESVKAELAKAQDQVNKLTQELGRNSREKRGPYRHNHQLEELRNLQEQLTQERTQWQKVKEAEELSLRDKREELQKLQEHLKTEKDDVNQQREHLYRQLETLQRKGIGLGPNMTIVTTGPSDCEVESADSLLSPTCIAANHKRSASCDLQQTFSKPLPKNSPHKSSPVSPPPPAAPTPLPAPTPVPTPTSPPCQQQQPVDSRSVKVGDVAKMVVVSTHSTTCPSLVVQSGSQAAAPKRDHPLPPNLYSATNQQKACHNLQAKQQLPLKLSSLSSGGGVSTPKSNSFSGMSSPLQQVLNNVQQVRSTADCPHPLQYSHSYPHTSAACGSTATGPGPANGARVSPSDPRTRDRSKRTRDPDTNQEIIFF